MNCYICNKKAIGKFTPDMDINGIGFCKEHEDVIRAGYIALVTGNEKLFKQLIKPYDNK